jgi:hypothetical protein
MILEATRPESFEEALEGLNQLINGLHAVRELVQEKGHNDPLLAGIGIVITDLQERGQGLYMGFARFKDCFAQLRRGASSH